MTPQEFTASQDRLNISRAEFCRRLGIAPNSGTAYALGRKPIPLTVELAAEALEARARKAEPIEAGETERSA